MKMIRYLTVTLTAVLLAGCAYPPSYSYHLGKKDFAEQNYKEAYGHFLESAKFGNANAQYSVSYMSYYGIGTTKNLPQAVYWAEKSAAQGDYKATEALALMKHQVPDLLFFEKEHHEQKHAQLAKPGKAPKHKAMTVPSTHTKARLPAPSFH